MWYSFRTMYEKETYTSIPKDIGQDVLNVSQSPHPRR